MINALRISPTCGAEIPADAPAGGCPSCLLRAGLGTISNEEGDTLVVTEGRHATRLHRSVALKVIEVPPGAGNSPAVRERFLREARAAAGCATRMLLRFTTLARCQSQTVAITQWNWWKAKRWKPAFGGKDR